MNLIDYKSIFFIVVLSIMNAAIECTHCKKDIKGEYYYLDDSKYHEDCYKKYIVPKCSVCKKSLSGSYMANEEGKYHNKCYRDHVLPKCSVCTNPLEKEIMQSVRAANVVAGNDPECSEWIANYREPSSKARKTRRRRP